MNDRSRCPRGGILVLLVAALAACAADDAASNGESSGPADPSWSPAAAWTVSTEPALSIGVDSGDEPYMFYRVFGAMRLNDGRVVVTDAGAHQIRIFDAEGTFLSASGRMGQGPGEFGEFSSMRLYGPTPTDLLLVGDTANERFNAIDSQGAHQSQLTFADAPNAARPALVGMFGDGTLFSRSVDGDSRLMADNPGSIIQMRYQLLRFGTEGEFLGLLAYADARPRYVNQVEGVTSFPFIPLSAEALAAPVGDRLWMTDGVNPELRTVDFDGNEAGAVSWEVTDRVRSEDVYARYVEVSLEQMAGSERNLRMYGHLFQQDLPLPEYIPLHQSMLGDADGMLWLERFRLPWQTQPTWDVVDPQRGWLGSVETPMGLRVLQIGSDEILGVHRGDDGVARVRAYAVTKPGR